MSRSLRALLPLVASTVLVALTGTAFAQGKPAARRSRRFGLGRAATPQEIAGWDIDVRPDGHGVRKGKGTVAQGQDLYDAQCASCHGTFGESNRYMAHRRRREAGRPEDGSRVGPARAERACAPSAPS